MKSKETKRREAAQRQEEYNKLSLSEKMKRAGAKQKKKLQKFLEKS